jgi:uncharacterized protein (DUF1501 family)
MTRTLHRRQFLGGLGAGAAGLALSGLGARRAEAQVSGPRFLIVLTCSGGASMLDGPLAIRASESRNARTLNTFPDAQVLQPSGSVFRAIDQRADAVGPIPIPFSANQSGFVGRHYRQMLVATGTGTSVNHGIAQRRAVTGNEAWSGRTLQEVMALSYGEGFALPNVHLATGTAFTERGTDDSLPAWAYGEPVADPALWPLALDGKRGQATPAAELVERARVLRNEQLDPASRFARVFGRSPKLQRWQAQRGAPQRAIEQADLISKLMLFPDSDRYPLSRYGLTPSAAATRVREVFPNFESDPLEAQAALAFLLLKFRVSVSVTLGPGFDLVLDAEGGVRQGLPEGAMKNTPIAFDFSHQAHRTTQALMWDRMYRVADGLITLLSEEEYASGQSLWDRSLMYFATDFGRSKTRPQDSEDFGSGHDLNNGALVVSPLVRGNRILGGVDPDTGLTYGYDPLTGTPNRSTTMAEPYLYAGLLQALGVDTSGSGLPSAPALRG